MGGLADTVSKLYRELHAKLFCSVGADVFLLDQAWMASGDHHRQRGIDPCFANAYACDIDGIQVYAAGESNRSGGTEQGLCDRSACKRSTRQRDHLEKCYEIFDAYDHYSACFVDRKLAWRYNDR